MSKHSSDPFKWTQFENAFSSALKILMLTTARAAGINKPASVRTKLFLDNLLPYVKRILEKQQVDLEGFTGEASGHSDLASHLATENGKAFLGAIADFLSTGQLKLPLDKEKHERYHAKLTGLITQSKEHEKKAKEVQETLDAERAKQDKKNLKARETAQELERVKAELKDKTADEQRLRERDEKTTRELDELKNQRDELRKTGVSAMKDLESAKAQLDMANKLNGSLRASLKEAEQRIAQLEKSFRQTQLDLKNQTSLELDKAKKCIEQQKKEHSEALLLLKTQTSAEIDEAHKRIQQLEQDFSRAQDAERDAIKCAEKAVAEAKRDAAQSSCQLNGELLSTEIQLDKARKELKRLREASGGNIDPIRNAANAMIQQHYQNLHHARTDMTARGAPLNAIDLECGLLSARQTQELASLLCRELRCGPWTPLPPAPSPEIRSPVAEDENDDSESVEVEHESLGVTANGLDGEGGGNDDESSASWCCMNCKSPNCNTDAGVCVVCKYGCECRDTHPQFELVLCSNTACNNGVHTKCHTPVWSKVPQCPWYCPACIDTILPSKSELTQQEWASISKKNKESRIKPLKALLENKYLAARRAANASADPDMYYQQDASGSKRPAPGSQPAAGDLSDHEEQISTVLSQVCLSPKRPRPNSADPNLQPSPAELALLAKAASEKNHLATSQTDLPIPQTKKPSFDNRAFYLNSDPHTLAQRTPEYFVGPIRSHKKFK